MNPFLRRKGDFNLYSRSSKNQPLPLYKDKPPSQRSAFTPSKDRKKSKKVMLARAALSSIALYIVYYFFLGSVSLPTFGRLPATSWPQAKQEVREVFLESWRSYEENAWGKDVFHPISGKGENMGKKPLGWFIVDSLDTLWIMDCKPEFAKAKDWVKTELNYKFDYGVNVFETTIRMLGGLLSAFHFSDDDIFLERAAELAKALKGGFDSASGIPFSSVNLLTGKGIKNHVDGGASSTAEVSTLQMEFRYLAKLTGEELYWTDAEKVMQVLDGNKPEDGLVPIYVHPDTGKYRGSLIRLGSRGDSYYEYLLKQFLQTKNEEPIYWQMYKESVEGVKKHLVSKLKPNSLTFIGELEKGIGGPLSPKMDHLVCFYGGLLALGATNGLTLKEARKLPFWDDDKESDFKLGEELTHTCYKMYSEVETGLSPEIVVFNTDVDSTKDFDIKPADRHNLQRPETVESFFYLYKLTGDEKYRQWGYEIFRNFVTHSRVEGKDGKVTYTSLKDVTSTPPKYLDNMESFWLAETLKYLYLLFDDDNKLPLTEYVFNTEAHPLPKFDMSPLFKTGWSREDGDKRNERKFRASVGSEGLPEPLAASEPQKIDKKNPPKAAPVAKKVDDELTEELAKDPSIQEQEKSDKKKVEDALKEIKEVIE
ncbi:hypothetical protein METBIDRAFT_37870 [Metschnikowia bicuspidata var. bicuspidata NRRL YB-4993]|uniref:alpha-1,2-Mannosidase n=1 Tax=Metschnikowia bicuspidata var. bicuspidata NRRL YB-4993 TaxID=869754 RepID=A0A1A0HHP5_9ASCO|nr:hypothetical protein METBIDRAFT_37870 [Metschnikowia bicuspidata var. bicuspidata NRRL YB-4993]OBA23402.1 hypothetical protein METBIDRAFT_37870 [Metschnikowia bicuspidata var. bicuspidata NRRL YB-4993]